MGVGLEPAPFGRHAARFEPYGILTPDARFPPRSLTQCTPSSRSDALGSETMQDVLWLTVLAGLFLLTLALVRLCEVA